MTGLTQLLAGNNSNPNFSWVTNNNFRAALTEASYSGLVMGFAGPASPQYWLRGTQYSNLLGVPGATYTRTGNRAGLDAAVIYRTNEARNTSFAGVVAGVVGSGGTAPTGNTTSPGVSGITSEILGTFTVSGQTVLRMRVSGTATGGNGIILFGPNTTGNAPAATQTSIVSQFSWLRLHAGSLATLNLIRQVTEARDASNARQNLLGGSDLRGSINSTLTQYAANNITIGGGATVTKVTTGLEITWANGAVIDFTLDIGVNQVEFAASCGDFIPNPSTTLSASQPRIAPSVGPGPELVTNGDFSNGTTGWTAQANTTLTVVSGAARVVNTIAAASGLAQTFTTVSGRSYRLTLNLSNLVITGTVRISVNNGGSPSFSGSQLAVNQADFSQDIIFTAAGATSTLALYTNSTIAGAGFDCDNISIREYRDAGSGLRVFGAGTNESRASEAFNDAAWTKSRSSITANTAVAPDGTLTADKLVEDTSTNTHRAFQLVAKAASAIPYTFSVFLKAAERTFAQVKIADSIESDNAAVDINLSTGAISGVSGSGFTGGSATILALANGWYRVTLTATTDTDVNISSFIFTASALGTVNYTGDGTSGILVWGAQLEQSSFATDYVPNPNTGASSSAGVDDVQVAASALPTSGPILFLADLPAQTINGISPRIFDWSSGLIQLWFVSPTEIYARSDGVGNAIVSGLVANGPRRIAMLYTPGAATRISVNGGAVQVGTDTGAAVPVVANYIGNRSGLDRPLNGGLGVLAIYRATPSDAQLQAMSALS